MTKEWITGYTWPVVPTAPGSILLAPGQIFMDWILPPGIALTDFDEPTVLRQLFILLASYDAIAAGDWTGVHVGAIVTRDDGTGAVPFHDPLYAGYYDWLWTAELATIAPVSTASVGLSSTSSRAGLWDIRSKRKIEAGEGIAFIASNDVASFGGAAIYWQGRTLLAHA